MRSTLAASAGFAGAGCYDLTSPLAARAPESSCSWGLSMNICTVIAALFIISASVGFNFPIAELKKEEDGLAKESS